MTVSIAQFFDRLLDSDVLPPSEVESLWKRISPEKHLQPAERVVPKLVERSGLTLFQAEKLLAGDWQNLVLGEYVLLRRLGAGGMGQVFQARHKTMRRIVALKVLAPSMTENEEAIKRFHREARVAAKLRHPHIVEAYDAGEHHGMHYLVMEYVEGEDLAHKVRREGPLAVERALGYVIQAAQGLTHAHLRGVIHRDMKPANLLADRRDRIKILDMGLARFDTQLLNEPDQQLTQTAVVMGSLGYMAPEQALDARQADARSDVYSLGCTLFYLLTGREMYEADTVFKRLLAHREQPIPSLHAERGDLLNGVAEAFERMVAKCPEDRYQSMPEVITALTLCLTSPMELFAASAARCCAPAAPLPVPAPDAVTSWNCGNAAVSTSTLACGGVTVAGEYWSSLSASSRRQRPQPPVPLFDAAALRSGLMAIALMLILAGCATMGVAVWKLNSMGSFKSAAPLVERGTPAPSTTATQVRRADPPQSVDKNQATRSPAPNEIVEPQGRVQFEVPSGWNSEPFAPPWSDIPQRDMRYRAKPRSSRDGRFP